MTELNVCKIFLVMNLIVVSTIMAKPINTTRSDVLKFYEHAIKLDDARKNKTITNTPTTRPVTRVKILSKFVIMKKKALERLHALKNRLTVKSTQESMVDTQITTLPYSESVDYESLEVTTYKNSEYYDEEFVDQLIKKYKMLSDLQKIYETTTTFY